MLYAYRLTGSRLERLMPQDDIAQAIWVDLYRPLQGQIDRVNALGVDVPTLEDMEEIEISNRLFHEDGVDNMTVVIPGLSLDKTRIEGPVTFMLSQARLVTVRHHAPRPFDTFPDRADKGTAGCQTPERLFLGLIEEIIARLADLMEETGSDLDDVARLVFGAATDRPDPDRLQESLRRVGREGEQLGRVRLALLTVERALSYFGQTIEGRPDAAALKTLIKGQMRDVQALAVHADFLSNRVSLATDATLGMINLDQNRTVRIVSVVAALFLPPTLIASIYGMNFAAMPELQHPWGYPIALGLMLASAAATYLYFKWRGWL